ncbi:transcription factor bHLH162-like [Impatiens glandulifera]|uniref:transcription factor bHLH162-like n=1 Tax=Impatiens glandulifera TaxID=253017 RepID=UPI001FB1630C|nr:transcription factor bHLH162-like [Impatiens glandulifera]
MDRRQIIHPSSSTLDRKIIERNRRNQMKILYSQLNSLISQQSSSYKNTMALTDQLDEATKYIKMMQTNIEELKKKRDNLMGVNNNNNSSSSSRAVEVRSPPQIEIRDLGSALDVTLTTGLDYHFMFNEIIRVIHEEGLEVVNASFSVVDGTVFHMIHSKVGEIDQIESSGVARVNERLKKFFL